MDYLGNPDAFELGETVAVIGVGNSAMDVARTALRHGARHVRLYARTREVHASTEELDYAQLEGAEIVYGHRIVELTDAGPLFEVTEYDEAGAVLGTSPEAVLAPSDSTVIAISQGPKNKLVLTTPGLECAEDGLLVVDGRGMTTVDGVFAAGDVVTGSNTVVHAVAAAKETARAMADYMLGMGVEAGA